MSESSSLQEDLNGVLGKYVSVWLWSILFGANSALLYSFASMRLDRPWGSLGLLLAIPFAIGALFGLIALFYLLRYLTRYLLPVFLEGKVVEETGKGAGGASPSRYLAAAFRSIALAFAMRLAIALATLLYSIQSF